MEYRTLLFEDPVFELAVYENQLRISLSKRSGGRSSGGRKKEIDEPAFRLIKDAKRKLELLTAREREILSFIVRGYSSKMISHETGIALNEIEASRAAAFRKIEAHSTADGVCFGIYAGLDELEPRR